MLMALVRCPECGREVSSMSENCIQCGFPLSLMMEEKIAVKKLDVKKEEKSAASQHIKITVEPVEVHVVEKEEVKKRDSSEKSERSEDKGIITLSEDKDIAKKSWSLGADEIMLWEASQVAIEGNNAFKWDWFISMTNQRFILSKLNHWKASAYTSLFGVVGSVLKKGIPAYEVPFEYISTIDMDKNTLMIRMKDNKEYHYTFINRREAKKVGERINGLFP